MENGPETSDDKDAQDNLTNEELEEFKEKPKPLEEKKIN